MFIFGLISALASSINLALSIFAGGKIDDAINALLTQLQQFRDQIVTAVVEILQAINGVRLEVDRVAANNAISLLCPTAKNGIKSCIFLPSGYDVCTEYESAMHALFSEF